MQIVNGVGETWWSLICCMIFSFSSWYWAVISWTRPKISSFDGSLIPSSRSFAEYTSWKINIKLLEIYRQCNRFCIVHKVNESSRSQNAIYVFSWVITGSGDGWWLASSTLMVKLTSKNKSMLPPTFSFSAISWKHFCIRHQISKEIIIGVWCKTVTVPSLA